MTVNEIIARNPHFGNRDVTTENGLAAFVVPETIYQAIERDENRRLEIALKMIALARHFIGKGNIEYRDYPCLGMSVASFHKEGKLIRGFSICGKKDKYVPEIGHAIAVYRAFLNMLDQCGEIFARRNTYFMWDKITARLESYFKEIFEA